jgi:predicted RNase H-like HicB family nuclease
MKYPVLIHKESSSDFGVTVPDLPGCYSAGTTMEEALESAQEAVLTHVEGLLMDQEPIPTLSRVHAVEPSAGLRHRTAVLHPELSGRLFEGELPSDLPPPVAGPYDGDVLSAVIMHIPDSELFDAVPAVRERLKDGGKLILSTPLERGDTPAGSDRDESGRLMNIRPASQVRLLFERLGFILKSEWTSADAAGRPNVLWVTMHFQYSRSTARPIDRIENTLNADKKVATYKLALIRALCDMALTAHALARWEPDGRVSLPHRVQHDRAVLHGFA